MQEKEIEKITSDIRAIQKTINTTTSALERADVVAEELIFAAANDQSRSGLELGLGLGQKLELG
jgi:hypothetical protein